MATNDKSQFVKEIESRLDALFGKDDGPVKRPESDIKGDLGMDGPSLEGSASGKAPSPAESEPYRQRGPGSAAGVFDPRLSQPNPEKFASILSKESPAKSSLSDVIQGSEKAPEEEAQGQASLSDANVIVLTDEFSDIKSIMLSPLKDLKTSVLSIEWEITPPILQNFDHQINLLEEKFADNKMICAYLRIMRFLGRYVQVKGTKSHPSAVSLLISIYNHLEIVTLSGKMAESRKWDLLEGDIAQYRKVVEKLDLQEIEESSIRQRTEAEPGTREIPAIEPPLILRELAGGQSAGPPLMSPHEAFALALEEIKKMISAEFSAIRSELKMWRESK